jgi:hypothetical protein
MSGTSSTRPPTSSALYICGCWSTARRFSPATPSSTSPPTARPCRG